VGSQSAAINKNLAKEYLDLLLKLTRTSVEAGGEVVVAKGKWSLLKS